MIIVCCMTVVSSSVTEFRLADFFSEKIIVGPHEVPDPPPLAQMAFTQCTSMSEHKLDSHFFEFLQFFVFFPIFLKI